MAIPAEIVQGATYSWEYLEASVDLAGTATPILSASYALTVEFRGNLDTLAITGAAATNARDWTVSLTATQTAALHAGAYQWQAFATLAAARYALDSGILIVLPDLAATQRPPGEMRSPARIMLENLTAQLSNAALTKTLSPDQIEALERVRKQAEWDCKRETDAAKLKAGGYPTNKMQVRFV